MRVRGVTVHPGFAEAEAKIWEKTETASISSRHKASSDDRSELDRLEKTFAQAGKEIEAFIEDLGKKGWTEELQIIEFQHMLLMDPEIVEAIRHLVEAGASAKKSFVQVMNQEISRLQQEEPHCERDGEDYFAGRAADYRDLMNRVLRIFHGQEENLPLLDRTCILVSRDLTPTEIIRFIDTGKVKGFALEKGGITSHAALIAASKKVPTLIGLGEGVRGINEGDLILFDGESGEVFIKPTEEEKALFERRRHLEESRYRELESIKGLPSVTLDGYRIRLKINISIPEEIEESITDEVEGVGLWRTEFLFMDRASAPDEEEQVRIYRHVSDKIPAKWINIRMLDVGSDKNLPYLTLPDEQNPSLGVRGIRFGLKYIDILKSQVRAVLRSNHIGNLRVLLPMVAQIEELERFRNLLAQCREELSKEGYEIASALPIGIMVEVPSTAYGLDIFLPHVDFLSVGSNDLIQYFLAVDRQNDEMRDIFSPFHPSLIQFLGRLVDIARKGAVPLSVCGAMASQPMAVPLLLGLGFEELSMPPAKLLEIKALIRHLHLSECRDAVESALHISNRLEIEEIFTSILKKS